MNIITEASGVKPSFYDKLLLRDIDERVCRTVRKGPLFEDDLLQMVTNDKLKLKIVKSRINRLVKLNLMRRRRTVDGRIRFRPGKSNVLRYADYKDTYDRNYIIDYYSLIERILLLCNILHIGAYFGICKDLAKQISISSDFISNRVHNLGPAIIYFVVRHYGLPVTRSSIAYRAEVSEPSLTNLGQKIWKFVNKNRK